MEAFRNGNRHPALDGKGQSAQASGPGPELHCPELTRQSTKSWLKFLLNLPIIYLAIGDRTTVCPSIGECHDLARCRTGFERGTFRGQNAAAEASTGLCNCGVLCWIR
jgi:hypothetical protein